MELVTVKNIYMSSDNQQLLVTISCLVYNHEPYLRQCLDGFVMQKTNFKFEAIVHDDASTDNSAYIIKEYAEKYPDIIKPIFEIENQYSKQDGSLEKKMAYAIKGKYIAICEGDDYWIEPLKLQKQVDYLEKHAECGLCYTCAKIYNEENQIFNSIIGGGEYRGYKELLLWNPIMTVTTLFREDLRQSFLTEVQPENKHWKLGDYPLWLWIACHSDIHFMNDVTSVYRCSNSSVSHQMDIKKQELFNQSVLDVKLYYLEHFPLSAFPVDALYDDFYRRNSVTGILLRDRGYAYENMKKIKTKNWKQKIKFILLKTNWGFLIANRILRSQYSYGV